ncbi:hypothetical protein D3C75_421920 [compost metagenome]
MTPARRKASLLPRKAWKHVRVRNTGCRSVTASSSDICGAAAGWNSFSFQFRPRIHSPGGVISARFAMACSISSLEVIPVKSSMSSFMPCMPKCTWASTRPGRTCPPSQSVTAYSRPDSCKDSSWLFPMAVMMPFSTSTASLSGRPIADIFPFLNKDIVISNSAPFILKCP